MSNCQNDLLFETVNLDISTAGYSPYGVDNFFWPHDTCLMLPVRDCLFDGFMPAIREACANKEPVALTARLFSKWFLFESIKVFELSSIYRKFKEKSVSLILPDKFTFLKTLQEGNEPRSDFFRKTIAIQSGRDRYFWIKKLIRELQWNKNPLKLLTPSDAGKDVSTFSPSPQTIAHARSAGKYLSYNNIWHWFERTPLSVLNQPVSIQNNRSFSLLISLLQDAFAAGGENPPIWLEDYFADWFACAINFSSFHLKNLQKKKEKLPGSIWSGTVNSTVWQRMFAHVVSENGGRVVVHDHGTDNSHFEQSWIQFVAYAGCDEFVAPNRNSMEIKKRELSTKYFFSEKLPQITCADEFAMKVKSGIISENHKIVGGKIKKIMYVPTAFHGEKSKLRPYFYDLVYFDWQARVLGFLQKLNIDVVYQPHPEGQTRPPDNFAESYGFHTHRGKFESCTENIDAYLIDFIASSTTSPIMKSNKPVIFMDPGFPELFPEAKELIKRRCYYIPCFSKKDNRLDMDWLQLKNALLTENHNFSTEFPDLYFEGQ